MNDSNIICDNPFHNIQVVADGRCHWCESHELLDEEDEGDTNALRS